MDATAPHGSTATAGRCRGDVGASIVEYAILIALVAVVCIVAMNYLGGATAKSFSTTADKLDNPGGSPTTVVVTTVPPTTINGDGDND
jgi:Flp pilus assembly pilin Flp